MTEPTIKNGAKGSGGTLTDFGFSWGPMTVTRLFHDKARGEAQGKQDRIKT